MNPVYARKVLSRVIPGDRVFTFEDDREAILSMAHELQDAYKAGQSNPHRELYGKISEEIGRGIRVEKVHVIGKHVVVETFHAMNKGEQHLFGVWAPEERDGKGRVLCYHYSLDEALLASLALNHGAKGWSETNDRAHYAGVIIGMTRNEGE